MCRKSAKNLLLLCPWLGSWAILACPLAIPPALGRPRAPGLAAGLAWNPSSLPWLRSWVTFAVSPYLGQPRRRACPGTPLSWPWLRSGGTFEPVTLPGLSWCSPVLRPWATVAIAPALWLRAALIHTTLASSNCLYIRTVLVAFLSAQQ